MAKQHDYTSLIEWTGDRGQGTRTYRGYDRTWTIATPGKPPVPCSNDPLLGGDPSLHNPEDLLLSSLSACHMLWYLHLAAEAGVVVTAYADDARGVMLETATGGGHFTSVTLLPTVTIQPNADATLAAQLHVRAHELCFIANSVNFPVTCEPTIVVATA